MKLPECPQCHDPKGVFGSTLHSRKGDCAYANPAVERAWVRVQKLEAALRLAYHHLIAHDIDEGMAGEFEIITDALNNEG